MTLEYSLTEDDYLQHQLFLASKSEKIKKKRINSWILTTLAFLSLGFILYSNKPKFMSYYFLTAGVLSAFLYPLYLRYYYKNHYKKFIADRFKNCFGLIATVKFNQDDIETFDITGESKINLSQLEQINEIPNYIYLRLKSGGSLIIPKLQISNIDIVRTELQTISTGFNVP